MEYFYFAATLPRVTMDDPVPWSSSDLLEQAAMHLSEGDLSGLKELQGGPNTVAQHPVAQQWFGLEAAIRNAIVRHRSARRKVDPAEFIHPDTPLDTRTEQMVSAAFTAANPLERERTLDRYRWLLLEEMAGSNTFSTEAVLAYGMRLRIAERWAAFADDPGSALADTIVNRDALWPAAGGNMNAGTGE
ncbi:MAG: hypothetical protein A2498_12580 [Lentisphaerae bacterium RIFOXYC12_FULL_60_16]|nr:MAG: hypothetical protein A2498_12580 [Lentisphaerae bacterium RIFOXYC12_FULL_60_16]OGV83735.1 MAG: hypothetical protein A2340_02220 [Lentisphaerae bacterium RIFOXYB12_FULL_60_10]